VAKGTETAIRFPKVTVNLTGASGNKYLILGKVIKSAKREKLPQSELDAFIAASEEAPDTNELVRVCADWFTLA
jgi:hypothetical protein